MKPPLCLKTRWKFVSLSDPFGMAEHDRRAGRRARIPVVTMPCRERGAETLALGAVRRHFAHRPHAPSALTEGRARGSSVGLGPRTRAPSALKQRGPPEPDGRAPRPAFSVISLPLPPPFVDEQLCLGVPGFSRSRPASIGPFSSSAPQGHPSSRGPHFVRPSHGPALPWSLRSHGSEGSRRVRRACLLAGTNWLNARPAAASIHQEKPRIERA